MPPINQHRLLTEKELSGWLGVSLPTLQRLRSRGGGPRFVRISLRRVGYRTTDVEAWLEERTAELLDTQLSASALQEECAR